MDLLVLALSALHWTCFATALAAPPPGEGHELHAAGKLNHVVERNASVGTQQAIYNIDPDIVNPLCGGIYPANINVQYAPDPFYLSTSGNKVFNFIGGAKGNKDVDVIFACTGQPTNGTGDRDVKVILNTLANNILDGNDKGSQLLAANMELVSEADDFIVSVGVSIAAKVTASTSKIAFQFIHC